MISDRPNLTLAATVDKALAKLEREGSRAAAAFLKERGASFSLTCRVLAEPGRRRKQNLDLAPPLR